MKRLSFAWPLFAAALLAGCGARPPGTPPDMRPVEPVAVTPAPVAPAGPRAPVWPPDPAVDLQPIPPGPRADAAMEAASQAMLIPPTAARTECAAEFAARFRLPPVSVLMGEQGPTPGGWFVDLGMPGNPRIWRCQTDPAGKVRSVTPL